MRSAVMLSSSGTAQTKLNYFRRINISVAYFRESELYTYVIRREI